MDFPKLISVRPVNVNMGSHHKPNGTTRTIVFELAPERDSIELTTGEVFSADRSSNTAHLAAQLTLTEYDPQYPDRFGSVVYVATFESDDETSPSTLCFCISLRDRDFQTLWDLASRRVFPNSFTLEVAGMSYGPGPDGTEKIWDTTAEQGLKLTSFSWRFKADAPDPYQPRSGE